ncbi:MAG: UDP-N-acetylglucosamine 2-epimerase (hydrolyzing) [Balneola sp.]
MRIGLLTSSRADFGIYKPLLNLMVQESDIELKVIAFGTHLSPYHGYTINEVKAQNLSDIDEIDSLLLGDNSSAISTSYGLTVIKFSDYWNQNNFDLVFCLGDRYEMSAAVQAGIPFGVKFAHIHGGEKTLGAIDNIYRHQITLVSSLHFTSTQKYAERVTELIESDKNVFNVGALSLTDLDKFEFDDEKQFREKFGIPEKPYLLITFHPETVNLVVNKQYVNELAKSLKKIVRQFYLVITLPNADTNGSLYRSALHNIKKEFPENVLLIENFGKENYFNAMKYSQFLLGNTSSGIIEAASFGKYVINVGNRQLGRVKGKNVFDCKFESLSIQECVKNISILGSYKEENIYEGANPAAEIMKITKSFIQ